MVSAFSTRLRRDGEAAYSELFNLHGDATWELPLDDLISFFRASDQTSDIVGRRQASTFQALASLAGHGEVPSAQKPSTKVREAKQKGAKGKANVQAQAPDPSRDRKAAPAEVPTSEMLA